MIQGTLRAFCLSFLFCLAACTLPENHVTSVQPGTPNPFFSTSAYPGVFDRIVVYGPLQVIITNDPAAKVYAAQSTQYTNLSSIATFAVVKRVLYIRAVKAPEKFSPYTTVGCLSVTVPQLNAVSVHNGGKIFIDNLNTPHFILSADGQGFIELNGRATRLDATLRDKTRLDARHLQVRTLFINTAAMAQADVQNTDGLSVLSTGKSDVYFYTDPAGTADYERQNGSTLRMAGLIPQPQALRPEDDRNIK